MPVTKTPAGTYQVRYETTRTFDTEDQAHNYEGLVSRAVEAAKRALENGEMVCPGIRAALPGFIEHHRIENDNKPCTVAAYVRRLNMFADYFAGADGDIAVDVITKDMVRQWQRERLNVKGHRKLSRRDKLSRDTANKDMDALKTFARWCVEEAYCDDNIDVLKIGRLKTGPKIMGQRTPRLYTMHNIKSIITKLQHTSPQVEIILRAMFLCGARPDQLFRMKWRDVHQPKGASVGFFQVPEAKGVASKYITLSSDSGKTAMFEQARRMYKQFHGRWPSSNAPVFTTRWGRSKRNPKGWTTDTFDKALDRAMRKAGIHQLFTAYDVRRSSITILARMGVKPPDIGGYAGHGVQATQERYKVASAQDGQAAYDIMEGLLSGNNECPEDEGATMDCVVLESVGV